jgi:hypothetical protein
MGLSRWKSFCRQSTAFVAALFFLAVPVTTPSPDVWASTETSPVSADLANHDELPADAEGDESSPGSEVTDVEELLREHESLRTFGPDLKSRFTLEVLGFALDRPEAVHRPPWA